MAVPKKKTSKSRRNMRRSHHALKPLNLVKNKTTGEIHVSHNTTPTGYYGDRMVKES